MDETVKRTKPAPTPIAPDKVRHGGRWVGWLLLILLAAASYFVYQRIHETQSTRRRAFHAPPQTVRTAAAAIGDMPITLTALGTVTPLDSVNVQTQIAGQLQKIGFVEGQMVKAGAFLAQIDPRPYRAALEQAQAIFQKDTAALAQAKADLARFERLIRQDSIAKQQVQDQQYIVQADTAGLAVDQANIDTAKLNLSYCTITAPIAGLAGLQQVNLGNYLQPSAATPIVTITQLEPISVVFAIPQQDLSQVRARMRAGAKLQATALDQTGSQTLATGTLTATESQISTATGTVNLKATFANDDGVLFPNQFVNVRLLVDTEKGVVLVPNPAIQRGSPGTFVYLVNADDKVSVQKVRIGPSDANHTAILSGLSAGQNVVVDGADRLSAGAKVSVRNEATLAAPTRPAASGGRRASDGGQGGPGTRAGRRGNRRGGAAPTAEP